MSGPLDGDKQDYLLRDSYFCGVKYGVFDLERLISSIEIDRSNSDESLVVPRESLYAVEQFIMAKCHMTWQVYRHKIRLVSDNMIVRALELGIEIDALDWLNKLYRYDGSEEFIVNYLQWDDTHVINELLHYDKKKGLCFELFNRLQQRNLFKVVFSEELSRLRPAAARRWLSQLKSNEKSCRDLEARIADAMTKIVGKGVRKEFVIINQFSMKSVREQARNKDLSIIVRNLNGYEEFDQVSQRFRSINAKESSLILEVYAPLEIDDPNERRKKKLAVADEIRKILIDVANEQLKTESEKGENKNANK